MPVVINTIIRLKSKLFGNVSLLLALLLVSSAFGKGFADANDVIWHSLGTNENDSMPIGNGDIALNVWTEQNGDIVLLLAKSDAWSENGQLLKLGRVRVRLTPNPFTNSPSFVQTLKLESGEIQIASSRTIIHIWADANHPSVHLQVESRQPLQMEASSEIWRKKKYHLDQEAMQHAGFFEWGNNPDGLDFDPDIVLPAQNDEVAWCHFNTNSIYPIVLQEEHLGSIVQKYPDPLLHRCFGVALTGPGLASADNHTLKSSAPLKNLRLDLIALTETNVDSAQTWKMNLDSLVKCENHVNLKHARTAHDKWWQNFWNRSWIHVSGTVDAAKVSQGYAMQRYMMACSSRGVFPVKFNGGLFTVGRDLPKGKSSNNENHDPDYRAWGNSYWNQNNRLLYWPLIATGDFDLLKPWFDMYVRDLPLAKDRTQIYYHHDGANLPETMLFCGLSNLNDFGWNNPTTTIQSHWQRYHIQGTLEVISQMLDEYDITRDANFARTDIVPFADAIVTYYGEHWPHDENGKIRMSPAQSLETYQLDAVNPTPDLAGLKSDIPRLLALPQNLTSAAQRDKWEKILDDLPPLPLGKTVHGKLGDDGKGDANGIPIILPAEKYGKTSNVENPESYVAFPYRLYGVGKPDLKLAQDTFKARRFPQNTCWGQDGTESAILGLTDVAKKAAIAEFTDYGDQRFIWFWKAGHDWIPDLDNGGSGMITLQNMLMQCDGKRILLLPAWPKNWNADFKLHAPDNTTVEGHIENGKVSHLKITPLKKIENVLID